MCLVVVIGGIGALKWARTGQGQATLLSMGSEKMYDDVQAAVDQALSEILPGFVPGPLGAFGTTGTNGTPGSDGAIPDDFTTRPATDRGGDFDWPVSHRGQGAAIRCREILLSRELSYWEAQRRVTEAVEEAGARVLWGERLYPDKVSGRRNNSDENRDLLRLDVGVAGRPTHTLIFHRQETGSPVRWDRMGGNSAWNSLQIESRAPTVALIVDDWGYARTEATSGILAVPVPLTLSVLPGLRYSRHFALKGTELILPQTHERAALFPEEGKDSSRSRRLATGCIVEVTLTRSESRPLGKRREIMLHLPMQANSPDVDPGPGAIMVDMSSVAIAGLVDQGLASLPQVAGVNNHMGSAATSDETTMQRLMKILQDRGLFFVDSLTTSRSRAYAEAVRVGVPALKNRIFLDYEHDNPGRVSANLAALVQSARATGFAVGICHPHPVTAEVLARELPRLKAEGICFVTVSEMLALQAGS